MKTFLTFLTFLIFLSCSQNLDELVVEANTALNNENYDRAILLYDQFIGKNKSVEQIKKAQFQKVKIYQQYMGDETRAYDVYNRLLKLELSNEEKIYCLEKIADIEWNILRNISACLNSFGKLEKLTNDPKYSIKRLDCAINLNDVKKFESFIKEYLKNEPSRIYDLAYFYHGLYYFNHQQWQKSIDIWLDKLNSIKSDIKFKIIFHIANSYESLENLDKAYYYYSLIKNHHSHPEIIKRKLKQVKDRKNAIKR